jgi:acyl-CoA reductase-like NAD-dependent aldehyde dehydrogenase
MNRMEFSRTARVPFSKCYGNFIGGHWAEPAAGRYVQNLSPVNGQPLCLVARSDDKDIDAAHAARDEWGRTSPAERAVILNKIARDASRLYCCGRAIRAGGVWTNCYHTYPAHAAFGGCKQSGLGQETRKAMLDHYQQTKNMLASYSPKKLGFF